jgi:Cu2+-exporting ATPase
MQIKEKGKNTDSSKIQVTEPSSSNKKHNYERKILENSHDFHEESGHKPVGNMLHHDHSEDQKRHAGEKSGHDHHGEGEHQNHEQQPYPQFEETKHEQHTESKHVAHEQHKEIRHQGHEGHEPSRGRDHRDHHAHMLADFKKRFIVSFILTFPVLLLSPTIQSFFGFELRFPGADFLTFLLSSVVYFYGGYPFLKGIKEELAEKSPGMMTLIAVAISVAYFYSSAVVFGLPRGVFFMELGTLVDVMLFGHWFEMRSIIGTSRALEELVKIMPSLSHLKNNGEIVDLGVDQLKLGIRFWSSPEKKCLWMGLL